MEKDKKDKLSKEFYSLDKQLSNEKARIKFLNEVDESTTKLNKSIGRCLNLLSESMKGPEIDIMFEKMHDSSTAYYKKISKSLEEELFTSQKEISLLRKKQDELAKKIIEEENKEE